MARRGDELRDHILWAAKDVFLELGFERTSMDVVAARAATTKRSLYAHFESKEKLYLAVIDLVRELFLKRLAMPADTGADPAEALETFCGRYLQVMLYEASIRMCRVTMAEAARFPQAASQHFDAVFGEVQSRLAAYLRSAFTLSEPDAEDAARRLLGRVLYPRFPRALFGMDPPSPRPDVDAPPSAEDAAAIRTAVAELMASLPTR